ncbi:hypothetical protein C8Q74DRAFT_1369825 [Fomes fomentarius]|nr:hypothetical protein C8Q74DRAFT_1369825 [Fomes fomentarius]
MAPVNTGASTEGHSLTTGTIVKMVIFLFSLDANPFFPFVLFPSFPPFLSSYAVLVLPFHPPSTPPFLGGFAFLIAGFCLVARRVRRARGTQTSTLTCNHTPTLRGDAAYSTSILSRASCPRCRANRRKPAAAPRANQDSLVSSPASSSSSPPPPYSHSLSPVELSELPGLELTGLAERALPATPPPVYRAAPYAIALTRGRD